jgi:hypothetical protein
LIRDKEGKPIGCHPQAFELRPATAEFPAEKELSATWIERFDAPDQMKKAAAAMRAMGLKVGKQAAFARGNVEQLKAAGEQHGLKLRVHCEPDPKNPGYAPVRGMRHNMTEFSELLAEETFAELYTAPTLLDDL